MGYEFKEDDIRQYLQMLQDTIKRMASNSSSCKNWTITIVTALLALMIGVDELREYTWVAIIPVLMFWGLDFYYLLLENRFRKHQREFVNQVSQQNEASWKPTIYSFDLRIPASNFDRKLKKKCFNSPSIVYFYPVFASLIVGISLLFLLLEPKQKTVVQDLETPLKTIALKQDTIVNAINELTDKYQPVQVQSKAFHNSSFFQADNVDSVQVNVIRGEAKKK